MWLLCDPDLLPVVGLPLRAGLQRARLCAVGPRRGAAAVRSGTVHQPLPEAFTTAAGALRKHKKFRDLNKMFHISIRIIQDLNEADEISTIIDIDMTLIIVKIVEVNSSVEMDLLGNKTQKIKKNSNYY